MVSTDKRSPLLCLTILLGIAGGVLPLVWIILLLVVIDAKTVVSRYALEPPESAGAYVAWTTAALIIAFTIVSVTCGALCAARERVARWAVYSSVAVYLILIILGHTLGAAQTSERQALATDFAKNFNDVYCSARTFEACVQGNGRDILVLTGRTANTTSVLQGGENVTAAASSIWSRCVIARAMNQHRMDKYKEGEYSYDPIYRLLDDCTRSQEVDAWCGRYTSLTDAATLIEVEHLATPSPFGTNSHMFTQYTGEWDRCMLYTDALLGPAVVCMLLVAWMCKASDLS